MGQYYKPAVITSEGSIETLCSHDFGNGMKLMEHSWIGNEFVNAVYSLIYKSPKQVAWVGDYSEQDYDSCDDPYTETLSFEQFHNYYISVWGDDSAVIPASKFSQRDLDILTGESEGMFLINHTLKVYLDLTDYIWRATAEGGSADGWCINPLPLLTACGNNRGGGDFRKGGTGFANVGIWAFHCLEYSNKFPKRYKEVKYRFFEDAR